jgi:hypothetical protein
MIVPTWCDHPQEMALKLMLLVGYIRRAGYITWIICGLAGWAGLWSFLAAQPSCRSHAEVDWPKWTGVLVRMGSRYVERQPGVEPRNPCFQFRQLLHVGNIAG